MIRHSCTPFRILLRNPKYFSTSSHHLQFRPPTSLSTKQLLDFPQIKIWGDTKKWDKITRVINSYKFKESLAQVCITQLQDKNDNLSLGHPYDRIIAYKYILDALIKSKSPLVWEFLVRTQHDGLLAELFGVNRLIRLYDSYAEMYISSTAKNDISWRAEDGNTSRSTNFSENIESPSMIVEKEIANYITLWLSNKNYKTSAKIVDDVILKLRNSSYYNLENVIFSILQQIQQNLLNSDKLKIDNNETNIFNATIPNEKVAPGSFIPNNISQSMFDYVLHSSILRLTQLKRFESVCEILKNLKETGNIFSSTEIRFPMISQGTFISLLMHCCDLLNDLQQTTSHNNENNDNHHHQSSSTMVASNKMKSITQEEKDEIIHSQIQIENILRCLLSLVDGIDPFSFHYREIFFNVIHKNQLTELKLQLFQEILSKGIPTSALLHCFIIKDYGIYNDFENAKYVFEKLRQQGNILVPTLYKDPRVYNAPNFKYRIQTKYIRKPGSVCFPTPDTTTSTPEPTHFWGIDSMAYEALYQAAVASGSQRHVKEILEEIIQNSFQPDFGFLLSVSKVFTTFQSDQLVPYVLRITNKIIQQQKMHTANWQPHTDLPTFISAENPKPWRASTTTWTLEGKHSGRSDSHSSRETLHKDLATDSDVCYYDNSNENKIQLNADEITKIFYHAIVATKLFGNSDRCLYIIKVLKGLNIKPTPLIMKDVFIRLLTDGRYEDILQLYLEMGTLGIPKDLRHATQLIEALAKLNRLSYALRGIKMLEEQETPAFLCAYLVVIRKLLEVVFQNHNQFQFSKSTKQVEEVSQAMQDMLRLSVYILMVPRNNITTTTTATYLSEEDKNHSHQKLVEMEDFTEKFERKLKIYSDIERYLKKLCHMSPELSATILGYLQSHNHPNVVAVTERLQTSLEKAQLKGGNKPLHKHNEMEEEEIELKKQIF